MGESRRVGLIDGDTIAYSAGFSSQTKTYHIHELNDEGTTIKDESLMAFKTSKEADIWLEENKGNYIKVSSIEIEDERKAIYITKKLLEKIKDVLKLNEARIFLSDDHTFRHQIAESLPYKGNRNKLHKPYYLDLIKQYLKVVHRGEIWDSLEADDAISISSYRYDADGHIPIVITIDKDLDQVPGHHYNFRTNVEYFISPKQATRNYYIQVLAGDRVDNIVGLKGVGPARAEKILGHETDSQRLANIVFQEYIKRLGKDSGPRYLEEVCKLVYILKNEEEKEIALKRIL